MQGTGTQSDPYQVTTIAELVEVFDIFSRKTEYSRTYCKLMNNLDFNDDPNYWNVPDYLFYTDLRKCGPPMSRRHAIDSSYDCLCIDGNGYGMYNIYSYNKTGIISSYCNTSGYATSIEIKNLTFEAIVIHSNNDNIKQFISQDALWRYWNYSPNVHFTNCDIRIKFYKYSHLQYDALMSGCILTNCIINIDYIINANAFTNNPSYAAPISSNNITRYSSQFNEWNINMILVNRSAAGSNAYIGLFDYGYNEFSSFFIQLNCMYCDQGNIYLAGVSSSNNFICFNSYFVIEDLSNTYTATAALPINASGVNFYDNQIKSPNTTISKVGAGELIGCTTAQCKDANYLEGLGFIIAT